MNNYLLPAVAMMLGWGLRGFIGGGPFGAMIPGAMVLLALKLNKTPKDVSLLAAFAAIGIGFGGEETYGQTVGFVVKPETFWWGALGLGLKGAVWGALGAMIMALSTLPSPRLVTIASLLMLAATELGWRLVNQPKLIYFSNRLDRPREEIWAGFLLASIALALLLKQYRFAAWGAIGGFVGFGLGGVIHGICNIFLGPWKLHSWKYMEFTFGFFFGLALAHVPLPETPEPNHSEPNGVLQVLAAIAITAYLFAAYPALPVRYGYMLAAVPLLIALTKLPWLAKHAAYTVTFTAFAFDLARYWSREYKLGPAEPAYAVAVLLSIAFAFAVNHYGKNTRTMLELMTWSAVGIALIKFAISPGGIFDGIALAFFAMALAVSWLIRRDQTTSAIGSGMPSHSNLSNPSMSRTPSTS